MRAETFDVSAFMFSMICAVLTIFVYLYVKILRNTLGKCIISCLFCMVVSHLYYILVFLKLMEVRMYLVHSVTFFMSAYFTWSSVISYHCWQTFKPVKSEEHRYQFLVYSAFVWITAAGIASVYIFNEYELAHELGRTIFLLGWQILSIFNFIMFILTANNIWKVKREMKRFERQKETTTTCFNFDTQTHAVCLRISVIMGVTWIYGTIKFFFYHADYNEDFFLNHIIVHLYFGILYFVLLVLKRSTLKLLMESIRERSNEKQVRAQRKKDLAEISMQKKSAVNANEAQLS